MFKKWLFNCQKSSAVLGTPMGISVHCLRDTLLHEVKGAGLDENSTIYEIEDLKESTHGVIRKKGATVISPSDNKMGAAYVDCLVGDDNVGPANRTLSYAWAYRIGDIIDTLEKYCSDNDLDPKRTYIWICCVCDNQHRVGKNVSFDTFHANIRNTVASVGYVLAMMAPLDKPVYLTRLRCLFELFTVTNVYACKVEIIMPPQQKRTMLKSLESYNNFVTAFRVTDITKAEVKIENENDRGMIMQLVERDFGFSTFNDSVNTLLEECILKMVLAAVDEYAVQSKDVSIQDYLKLCLDVGQIMKEKNKNVEAMALYYRALEVQERVYGEDHIITADTYSKIGLMMHDNNDLENALIMFKKVLAVEEKINGKAHTSTAYTYCNIGLVKYDMQYFDNALEMFRKALAVEEKEYGANHASTAGTYYNIGDVMKSKGEIEEALKWYRKALAAEKIVYGEEHSDTLTTTNEIRKLENSLAKL